MLWMFAESVLEVGSVGSLRPFSSLATLTDCWRNLGGAGGHLPAMQTSWLLAVITFLRSPGCASQAPGQGTGWLPQAPHPSREATTKSSLLKWRPPTRPQRGSAGGATDVEDDTFGRWSAQARGHLAVELLHGA